MLRRRLHESRYACLLFSCWVGYFVLTASALAADWKPANPLEIVIPNAPGGGNDAVGRLLLRVWQERRLTPTAGIVVNKAGGGGTVALNYLGQKASDPHA